MVSRKSRRASASTADRRRARAHPGPHARGRARDSPCSPAPAANTGTSRRKSIVSHRRAGVEHVSSWGSAPPLPTGAGRLGKPSCRRGRPVRRAGAGGAAAAADWRADLVRSRRHVRCALFGPRRGRRRSHRDASLRSVAQRLPGPRRWRRSWGRHCARTRRRGPSLQEFRQAIGNGAGGTAGGRPGRPVPTTPPLVATRRHALYACETSPPAVGPGSPVPGRAGRRRAQGRRSHARHG